MKTVKEILKQEQLLLKTMIKIEGEPEGAHYYMNGAFHALIWLRNNDVDSPYQEIKPYLNISKKIKGKKTSQRRKVKGKEKSPMRKKENQQPSLA